MRIERGGAPGAVPSDPITPGEEATDVHPPRPIAAADERVGGWPPVVGRRLSMLARARPAPRRPVAVAPDLYVASLAQVRSWRALVDLGITQVVNATCEPDVALARHFPVLQVALPDSLHARMDHHFAAVYAAVESARARGGATVVHCWAGVSRSTTLVIACLMLRHRWPLREAIAHVRRARPQCEPNIGFIAQLRALELALLGREESTEPLTRLDRGLPPAAGAEGTARPPPAIAWHREARAWLARASADLDGDPGGHRARLAGHAAAMDAEDRPAVARHFTCNALEIWAGQHPGDCRARALLPSALATLVAAEPAARRELAAHLEASARGPRWQDFRLDVPRADAFLRALVAGLVDETQASAETGD